MNTGKNLFPQNLETTQKNNAKTVLLGNYFFHSAYFHNETTLICKRNLAFTFVVFRLYSLILCDLSVRLLLVLPLFILFSLTSKVTSMKFAGMFAFTKNRRSYSLRSCTQSSTEENSSAGTN